MASNGQFQRISLTRPMSHVAPRTGKIMSVSVFEKEIYFLQNGILHFVLKLSQLS